MRALTLMASEGGSVWGQDVFGRGEILVIWAGWKPGEGRRVVRPLEADRDAHRMWLHHWPWQGKNGVALEGQDIPKLSWDQTVRTSTHLSFSRIRECHEIVKDRNLAFTLILRSQSWHDLATENNNTTMMLNLNSFAAWTYWRNIKM